jgi:hypothetical protein
MIGLICLIRRICLIGLKKKKTMITLQERIRKYIGQMPASVEGSGGNAAMFAVCSVLVNGFDLPVNEALREALDWNEQFSQPKWSEKELLRMVESAKSKGSSKGAGYLLQAGESWKADSRAGEGVKAAPKREQTGIPKYDETILQKLVAGVPAAAGDVKYFMERSPIDPRTVTAATYLDAVFAPGDRVLVFTSFTSQGDFLYEVGKGAFRLGLERGVKAVPSELPKRGAEGVWYLNQPVSGLWIPNKDGKYSRRSEMNITAWKHIVLESDEAPEAMWLRLMAVFPKSNIKAIYSSGGRSWHVLLSSAYDSKAAMDVELTTRVKKTLPVLGADPGALTSMRLTRLPTCLRGMREQKLIYLDPAPDGVEIMGKPILRRL